MTFQMLIDKFYVIWEAVHTCARASSINSYATISAVRRPVAATLAGARREIAPVMFVLFLY